MSRSPALCARRRTPFETSFRSSLALLAARGRCRRPRTSLRPPPRPPPAPPGAARPQEQAFPPVSESVDVSVTSVDVVVTDSKGTARPRPDGGRLRGPAGRDPSEDHQLLRRRPAARSSSRTASRCRSTSKEQAAPRCPASVKAHYIFYIDNLNIQPQNRNRMFKRLKEFIPQAIGPNAEGMVVTYNRSLKVRQHVHVRRQRADRRARGNRARHRAAATTHAERAPATRCSRSATPRRSAEAPGATPTCYAKSLRNDLEFTVDAIKETIDSLAGLPGAQEPRLHLGGAAGHGGARALRGDPREVPGPVRRRCSSSTTT